MATEIEEKLELNDEMMKTEQDVLKARRLECFKYLEDDKVMPA